MRYKMLLLDVDGVLTDGSIYLDRDGYEIKCFNVKDGLGIKNVQSIGMKVGIITGRSSKALMHRLNSLNINVVYDNVSNKLNVYEKILAESCFKDEDVCYMGDDLPDIPVLKRVGLSCCPSDAVHEVKRICKLETKCKGGCGAVRELTDFILRVNNA